MAQNKAVEATKTNPGKTATAGALAVAMTLAVPLVAKWEGKRNDPYLDLVKIPTVCYGETNVAMRHHSDAECRDMLVRTLQGKYAAEVIRCTPVLADKPQRLAAATSLSYNIGTASYCRSTAARLFNAGDMAGGCKAIGRFTMAGGRVVQGLVNRRADEVRLCLS